MGHDRMLCLAIHSVLTEKKYVFNPKNDLKKETKANNKYFVSPSIIMYFLADKKLNR